MSSEPSNTTVAGESGQPLEELKLRADLAKLDLIEAQGRASYGDDCLTILDVAAINKTAESFGVLRLHAYNRLKELGLLSYQRAALAERGAGR